MAALASYVLAEEGRVGRTLNIKSGMCVTCSCTNCKGNCCGFSSLSSFMCYDAECICCKFHTVNGNKDKYCTFHASETFLSNTCLRFKCYQQACCFEFFCTLLMDGLNGDPFRPTEKVVFEPTVYSRDGFIRFGMCCCVSLLDNRYPECYGCHRYSQVCCCVDETLSFKPLWFSQHEHYKRRSDQCFMIGKHRCSCLREPTACCKCTDEWCGRACRCAFPSDHDVPCVCTILPYCTICAKGTCFVRWCAQLQDLPGNVVPFNDSSHQSQLDQQSQLNHRSNPSSPTPSGNVQIATLHESNRQTGLTNQANGFVETDQVVYAGTAVYAEPVAMNLASPDTRYNEKAQAMQR